MTTKEEALKQLQKFWVTPGHKLAFAGLTNLYQHYKGLLTLQEIKNFLARQRVYVTHKETKKVRHRNPYFIFERRKILEGDLIDFKDPKLIRANLNMKYLLVTIDVFSRKVWCRLLKTKSAAHVVPAFRDILQDVKKGASYPEVVLTDRGNFNAWDNSNTMTLLSS